jgi:hypothetical protein
MFEYEGEVGSIAHHREEARADMFFSAIYIT